VKVSLHQNGRIEIELTPEDAIESTVVNEMVGRAERGQTVMLERRGDAVVVGVQK
jgi:hypothetical protein